MQRPKVPFCSKPVGKNRVCSEYASGIFVCIFWEALLIAKVMSGPTTPSNLKIFLRTHHTIHWRAESIFYGLKIWANHSLCVLFSLARRKCK